MGNLENLLMASWIALISLAAPAFIVVFFYFFHNSIYRVLDKIDKKESKEKNQNTTAP